MSATRTNEVLRYLSLKKVANYVMNVLSAGHGVLVVQSINVCPVLSRSCRTLLHFHVSWTCEQLMVSLTHQNQQHKAGCAAESTTHVVIQPFARSAPVAWGPNWTPEQPQQTMGLGLLTVISRLLLTLMARQVQSLQCLRSASRRFELLKMVQSFDSN